MRRPNPPVEPGRINSVIVGGDFRDSSGVVSSRGSVFVEKSFHTPAGTTDFTQLTLDGRVRFPTFGSQALQIRAHAVITASDHTPASRLAYIGGSGTLPVLELLEFGGDELLFVENRYLYPLERVTLPVVGHPVLTLRHLVGAAGIGSLPSLEQEMGIGIGISALRFDFNTDVSHSRGGKFGVGISFGH
jgi:hypothetical protein